MLFEWHSFDNRKRLTSTDKIDDLLDSLVGICFDEPDYLRRCHAARHVVLLNEFREYQYEHYRWNAPTETCRVGDLPINEVSPALSDWIASFFENEHHPLLPSYALDTARFIQEHLVPGYHGRPENWEIKPLVDPSEDRDLVRFIDPSFKKDFTQNTGLLFLGGKVPAGCAIEEDGKTVLEAGSEFISTAIRCHLSSGIGDFELYRAKEHSPLRYDLHREFKFYGGLLVLRGEDKYLPITLGIMRKATCGSEQAQIILDELSQLRHFGSGFKTPAHWIESVIEFPYRYLQDADEMPRVLPVPEWDVKFS